VHYKPIKNALAVSVTPAIANLLLRLVSGTVFFFLTALVILYATTPLFWFSLALVLLLVGKEWFHLIQQSGLNFPNIRWTLLCLGIFIAGYTSFIQALTVVFVLSLWYPYALIKTLQYGIGKQINSSITEKNIEAILCLSLFCYFALQIQQLSPLLTLFCFATVCCIDIGGYVGGKLIGGMKLCPRLSPNKTIAGLCGGIIFCYICYFAMATFVTGLPNSTLFIALLLPFCLITQSGDLYQSMLKRQANKKDSGQWIPGHGGLFDRTDGLLFGAPSFYYLLLLCE